MIIVGPLSVLLLSLSAVTSTQAPIPGIVGVERYMSKA